MVCSMGAIRKDEHWRRLERPIVLLLSVALVSGCGTMSTVMPWFKPRRPPPTEIVIPPINTNPAATVTASIPVLPRPKPEAERPLPSAIELVGLTPKAVRNLIGKPTLLRKERNAQIWHYRNMDCTLFLFFYPIRGQGARVSHVDVADTGTARRRRASGRQKQLIDSCLATTMMTFGSRL